MPQHSVSASSSSSSSNNNNVKKRSLTEPQPRNHLIFDPWNSSSTGHQRAEGPYAGTIGWRETRRRKLAGQFTSTTTVQAQGNSNNNEANGEWKWMDAHESQRNELGVTDIRRYMGGVSKGQSPVTTTMDGKKDERRAKTSSGRSAARATLEYQPLSMATSSSTSSIEERERERREPEITTMAAYETHPSTATITTPREIDLHTTANPIMNKNKSKGIFSTLTFYINGSTYPTISDHKLKRLLVDEGGSVSLHLARKTVTHVILSTSDTNNMNMKKGGGGVLAAGKLQKEVLMHQGSNGGIKYVTVEWVIESIKAGKKLSEARFGACPTSCTTTNRSNNSLVGAPVGQRSVYEMFKK